MLAILFSTVAISLYLSSCANPTDIDVNRLITSSYVDQGEDDPRFDTLTASVECMITLKANMIYKIDDWAGSGLHIALVFMLPDTSMQQPYKDVYDKSAIYFKDNEEYGIGLRLRATLTADMFKRQIGARVAVGIILLYLDRNDNQTYDIDEPIYGASEQQLFAFAEGKRLPAGPFKQLNDLHEGPNALIRFGDDPYPSFKSQTDYNSSFFTIYVRGPEAIYSIPYPWHMSKLLPVKTAVR
jgi:hypothetical protein